MQGWCASVRNEVHRVAAGGSSGSSLRTPMSRLENSPLRATERISARLEDKPQMSKDVPFEQSLRSSRGGCSWPCEWH